MRPRAWSSWANESTWTCSSCRSKQLQLSSRNAFLSRDTGLKRDTTLSGQTSAYDPLTQRRWLSSSTPRRGAPTRTPKLPDSAARTRFAPSPTGYLHIGGLRTALFSYLLAKRTGGQFVLRIEDTDQKRLVQNAERKLFEDLQWAGLQWDEGPEIGGPYGPYKQSRRNEIYKKHALELLQAGQAYRCFCTPQTAGEAKAAYVTSGCYQNCSSLSEEQSEEKATSQKTLFTVRLRQPPDAHKRTYPDLIYGNIQRLKRSPSPSLSASEDDTAVDASDTVLVKSDGTPTYHFANVVDDHLMGITHVIRGSEWMASTPLHYDIYSAFDWKPPQFAHVGLLVDQNKAKLSKRNADLALDVASMRDKHGVLPETLVNFLALLGWSNPTSNDVMEMDDLVKNFDLKFTRGNAMVKMEKLWFLQRSHVALQCEKATETEDFGPITPLVDQITAQVIATYPNALVNQELDKLDEPSHHIVPSPTLAHYVRQILLADSKSFQNASQFVERNRYFFAYISAHVPAEQAYYNKAQTLTAAHLNDFTQRLFCHSWQAKNEYPEGLATQEDTERGIQRVLATEAWKFALDTSIYPVLCSPPEGRLPEWHPESIDYHSECLEGNPAFRPKKMAEMLTPAHDEILVKRYKAVHGGLMRYLREKLCFGLPGPNVSAVMAILGREECSRRLCESKRTAGE